MFKLLFIFLEWLTAVDGLTISFKNADEYFNIYINPNVLDKKNHCKFNILLLKTLDILILQYNYCY